MIRRLSVLLALRGAAAEPGPVKGFDLLSSCVVGFFGEGSGGGWGSLGVGRARQAMEPHACLIYFRWLRGGQGSCCGLARGCFARGR